MDGRVSKWQVVVGGFTVIGAIAAVLALLPHGSGPSPARGPSQAQEPRLLLRDRPRQIQEPGLHQ
jgi:hypothetical protein